MLDYLLVLSHSGHTLFSKLFTPTNKNTINHIINTLILSPTQFQSFQFPETHQTIFSFLTTQCVFVLCKPAISALVHDDTLHVLKAFSHFFSEHVLDTMDPVSRSSFLHFGVMDDPAVADKVLSNFFSILNKVEDMAAKKSRSNKSAKFLAKSENASGLLVNASGSKKNKKKSNKQPRSWDNNGSTSTSSVLDFSSSQPLPDPQLKSSPPKSSSTQQHKGTYVPEALTGPGPTLSASIQTAFKSILSTLTLQKAPVTETQLKAPTSHLKSHLISKNVPIRIANEIVDSVTASLVGQTHTNVVHALKLAINTYLQKILSTSACTDLMDEIRAKKRNHAALPYVIVFCGVNGVGKSTNLAKVAFWLLQNALNVLVIGGDSFRSGAVEQLRVHVANLSKLTHGNIQLFERGYGVDAAVLARDGIRSASSKFDVVLIDTAGRMQNNEPLMRSLAKLIALNQPDKVIFVGEALVGNESIDQISKFNEGLVQFSTQAVPHEIDAMILTKFDVIRDKVGSAVAMAYITGKPILFVGTGQTYVDLKRVNVDAVVDTLLSD